MRITWIARSFLDYRIPVFKALDELCGHQLTLIYNADIVPVRCSKKVTEILGGRAIGLRGEKRIKSKNITEQQLANVGFSIPYHKDLIRIARQSCPEVIISDGYLKWTYASLWIRLFNYKKIKHVMCYERTFHTERNAGWIRTAYRKFMGLLIDAIDCNGVQTVEYVQKGLKYKKHITVGHMVADTSGILSQVMAVSEDAVEDIRKKYDVKGVTFIYVGRLSYRKGVMPLLRAWKSASLENATLLLVGDGEFRVEIEQFIEEFKLKNVRVIGSIDYDDLGPWYKTADCFIIPTLEDNWSLVVPEAMAAGLPIACSIYNGCYPELVHPENGWTFDPLNVESIESTLMEIMSVKDMLPAMGKISRKIVANHTPRRAAESIYNACLKVIVR